MAIDQQNSKAFRRVTIYQFVGLFNLQDHCL